MFRPSPMHVTRAVQQAYGIDHPIGDPFGGAAYGEKNGGGSIGKVFSSVVPMVAGAAMMIGSGGMMAPMLIGGAMFAGGAMSGIGALSGNQTLSKIGNITSAVAGVAALGYSAYSNWDTISNFFASGTETAGAVESGAGVFGGPAGAAEGTVGAYGAGAEGGVEALTTTAGQMSTTSTPAAFQGAAWGGPVTGGVEGTVGAYGGGLDTIPTLTSGNTAMGANAITNTSMSTGGFGAAQPFVGTPAALPGGGASFGSTGAATIPSDGGGFVSGMLNAGGEAAGGGSGGILSSVGNFIQKNPIPSLMAFQSLAGLAEGASPKSQAEGEYIQAMTAAKEAETAYLNAVKAPETAANTEYLLAKAAEWDKTKKYEEEKRAAYNASIAALNPTNTGNLAQTMYGGAQTGLINQARA